MENSNNADESKLPLFFLKDKGYKKIKCNDCLCNVFWGLGSGKFKCKKCGLIYHAASPNFSTWEFLGYEDN